MGKTFLKETAQLLQAKRRKKRWTRTVISLSLVVALVTSSLLSHPAITMESTTTCGMGEHAHTADCYQRQLICGQEERAAVPATEEKVLNCSTEVHEHTDGCKDAEGNLICGKEAHTHGDNCYQTVTTPGVEGHSHSDACYQSVLTCNLPEHTHSDSCYPQTEAAPAAETVPVTEAQTAAAAEAQTQATEAQTQATEAQTQPATPAQTETIPSETAAQTESETEKVTEKETEKKWSAQELKASGSDYKITVKAPASAKIPDNAVLKVKELKKDTTPQDYAQYTQLAANKAAQQMAKDILYGRYFDLAIEADGKEIQPSDKVTVTLTYSNAVEAKAEIEVKAVYFGDQTELLNVKTNSNGQTWTEAKVEVKKMTVLAVAGIGIEETEVVEVQSETEAVTEASSETELETEVSTEAESETELETETETEVSTEVETETETETETEVSTEVETETETETEVETETETEIETETETEVTANVLTMSAGKYTVTVSYGADAGLPENVTLRVTVLGAESQEYQEALQAVIEEKKSTDAAFDETTLGMDALDITLLDADGNEVEPAEGAQVDVKIELNKLPEDVDADALKDTMEVQHIKDAAATTVADTGTATDGSVQVSDSSAEVGFTVDHFSTFTVTWTEKLETSILTADGATYRVTVEYGSDAGIPKGATLSVSEMDVSSEAYQTEYDRAEAALGNVSDNLHVFQMRCFDIKIMNGETEIQPAAAVNVTITAEDIANEDGFYVVHTHEGSTELISAKATVLNESETQFAFETERFSTFTLTSAGSKKTLNVGDIVNITGTNGSTHSWSSEDSNVIKINSSNRNAAEVEAVGIGVSIITHSYKNSTNRPSRPGENENDQYNTEYYYFVVTGEENIRVYVYVSTRSYNEDGTYIEISEDCLRLLGIDGSTEDANGYFPAGEISLSSSFLAEKENAANTSGAALINNEADWNNLMAALANMKTSDLYDDSNTQNQGGINYSLNQNNSVANYISQAEKIYNQGWGSKHTALFRWHKVSSGNQQSYGFQDQTVKFHLDLSFNTKKITFIYGNNGINGTDTTPGKDGTTIETRLYIEKSEIQSPNNLTIPDGYTIAGYYGDANFTTPWNKFGQPITQDEVVYVKLIKNSEDDTNYIIVTKEFSGLTDEEIAGLQSSFKINLVGNEISTALMYNNRNEALSKSTKWVWKVDGALAGSYAVSEENANVSGYQLTATGIGTVRVAAGTCTLANSSTVTTKTWTMGDDEIFYGTLKNGIAGGITGTIIITSKSLSASQRLEIINKLPTEYNKESVYFYSKEKNPNGFAVNGINVSYANNNVTFSDTLCSTAHKATFSVDAKPEIAVKNSYTLPFAKITIKKTDDGKTPAALIGAEFKLHKKRSDSSSYEIVKINNQDSFIISDANGYTINELEAGDYKLVEIKAPAGYIIENAETYFALTINSDGNAVITLPFSGETNYNPSASVESGNADTIVIKNKAGVALPNTGGSGTQLYTLSGLLLLAVALMYGLVLRRRREGGIYG